jgi:D-alanyl-D-alanine carboxypeptidase/D-alanyl-D-alanine-endopeptidase (penicillin-binding protein 4)
VDDSLYPEPTRARGWPTGYWPYIVSPTRPLVRDLRSSWDTSADAARYFASVLATELARALRPRTDLAPVARYTGRLVADDDAAELARITGNSVGAALRYMLLVSHNNSAEMLFRNNALAMGRPATWSAAKSSSTSRLAALGVNVRGWELVDGSGVSRRDRVTAR